MAQSLASVDHRLIRVVQTVLALPDGEKRMVVIHKLDGNIYACAVSTTSRTSLIRRWESVGRVRSLKRKHDGSSAERKRVVNGFTPDHVVLLTLVIPQADELLSLFVSTEQSVDRILGTFTSASGTPGSLSEICSGV